MGAHEFVADLVLDLADKSFQRIAGNFKEQFASQRVSVGVQAVGGQAENAIPHLHIFAADDAVAFDYSNNESGEVVLAIGIKPRHFRGLAADQSAAVMLAGFGQAADNSFGDLRIQRSRGQVVHEKQRRRTLHRDVVDAVIHQVAADGVMHAHVEGDFQLGAHAIHA